MPDDRKPKAWVEAARRGLLLLAMAACAQRTAVHAQEQAEPAISAPATADVAAVGGIVFAGPLTETFADDPRLAGRYRGRVLRADGAPIRGARIYLSPKSNEPIGPQAVRAETDADGRFEFDAPDMTYIDTDGLPARLEGFLSAAADGYAADWRYTADRKTLIHQAMFGGSKQGEYTFRLDQGDVPIRGRFLGPDGLPLVGAAVRLTNVNVPLKYDLDAHLAKEIKRSPGSCSASYERSTAGRAYLLPELVVETRTDAEGRFTISGVGRDRIAHLSVTAPAIVNNYLAVMTREAPDVEVRMKGRDELWIRPPQIIHGAEFTQSLASGRLISGVVRDRASGKPIAGMVVGTGREDYPRDGAHNYLTTTDAEGRFTMTGLDPSVEEWAIAAESAPGMAYQSAVAVVKGDAPAVIECDRGIPFRLKLVDEAGRPVEAEVKYYEVRPNPHAPKVSCLPSFNPISETSRNADGSYQGFVLPGPGAVLVKTPDRVDYLPAYVDPQKFFGRGWNEDQPIDGYGSRDTISTVMGATNTKQADYAAIVLVDPAPESQPLELTATVRTLKPRMVTLVGPAGKPVAGAETEGMKEHYYNFELRLRAATFPLWRHHPQRPARVTFFDRPRQLVGFLMIQGDDPAAITVRMEPWAAATGRLLDSNGAPLRKASLVLRESFEESSADPRVGEHAKITMEADGRFRLDELVPGQRYAARIFRDGKKLGTAFENIIFKSGEVRELGDLRLEPPQVAVY